MAAVVRTQRYREKGGLNTSVKIAMMYVALVTTSYRSNCQVVQQFGAGYSNDVYCRSYEPWDDLGDRCQDPQKHYGHVHGFVLVFLSVS